MSLAQNKLLTTRRYVFKEPLSFGSVFSVALLYLLVPHLRPPPPTGLAPSPREDVPLVKTFQTKRRVRCGHRAQQCQQPFL